MLKDKILTLENLEKKGCNRLPTATCVMCHAGIEIVNHLFLHCPFVNGIWDYFCNLFQLRDAPQSMCRSCREWTTLLRPANKDRVILIMKDLVWYIWLARNDRIFNDIVTLTLSTILKIDCMILSWFSAAANDSKAKFENSIHMVRHSLEFLQ